MARVICTLPNASTEIDGVAFTEDRGQMISAEMDQAQAERFASIPGFSLVEPPKPTATQAPARPSAGQETAKPSEGAGAAQAGTTPPGDEMSPAQKRKMTLAAKEAAQAEAAALVKAAAGDQSTAKETAGGEGAGDKPAD